MFGEDFNHFYSLLSNFTLQYMPIPLSDVTQAYRSAPDRTEQALTKVRVMIFFILKKIW